MGEEKSIVSIVVYYLLLGGGKLLLDRMSKWDYHTTHE